MFKSADSYGIKDLALALSQSESAGASLLSAGQYYFDVDSEHWASEAINAFAKEEVYFQSDMNTKLFQPNDNMTRATLVYGLTKAMHQDVSSTTLEVPFTDLDPASLECIPYIHWAYANKIVSGTSETTFNPNGDITRQDFLTISGRYLSIAELALPKSNAKITQFTDHTDISCSC